MSGGDTHGPHLGERAGLTGTGGGIFLTPLLVLAAWTGTRDAAGLSGAFIGLNSIAGLAGLATGGFTLPAFALADDGYLVLHEGRIYCGSDWIPEWTAITSLDSERMLVVRYPIRTKGDLLPVRRLDDVRCARQLDLRWQPAV